MIKLGKKLGSGAFGTVFDAEVPETSLKLHQTEYMPSTDKKKHMKVAVKMMKGEHLLQSE